MLKICATCAHGGRVTKTRRSGKRYQEAAEIHCNFAEFSTPLTETCPHWDPIKSVRRYDHGNQTV